MPKKIRELKQELTQMGFQKISGKGSHTNWIHSLYAGKLTPSGKNGGGATSIRYNDRIEIIRGFKAYKEK
jgi:hypothetical protein